MKCRGEFCALSFCVRALSFFIALHRLFAIDILLVHHLVLNLSFIHCVFEVLTFYGRLLRILLSFFSLHLFFLISRPARVFPPLYVRNLSTPLSFRFLTFHPEPPYIQDNQLQQLGPPPRCILPTDGSFPVLIHPSHHGCKTLYIGPAPQV